MAMKLDIVTPSRRVIAATCEEVYLPGYEGEMGVQNNAQIALNAHEWQNLVFESGGRVWTGRDGTGSRLPRDLLWSPEGEDRGCVT